ncbi:MAG: hypothetical protein HGA19_07210 [Oscillochloris sp.]|nr:hypothetical protein [Oscillochloris sp.]
MNRSWNWQGWLALAISSLALFVALGGNVPWSNQRQTETLSVQIAPQAVESSQVPSEYAGRHFGRGQDSSESFQVVPSRGNFREDRSGPMGHYGHFGFFGPLAMLMGLAKLVALGLLAWLLLRMFNQRHNHTPPAAPPITPAGHDPRVE